MERDRRAPQGSVGASLEAKDAPLDAKAVPVGVTRELANAFLALKTTQARIQQVIRARCPEKVQRADRMEILQDVNVKLLTTTALPRTPESLRPWVSRTAQNAVVDFFRRRDVHLAWLRGDVEVEELPPDPVDAPDDEVAMEDVAAMESAANDGAPKKDDAWTIGPWVRLEIAKRKEPHRSRDTLVLEMLAYRAAHAGITDEELSALFGLTRDQYKHRLASFRARYLPMRKRYVERRDGFLVVLLVALAVLLAWLLLRRPPAKSTIHADPETKPLVPPSPSASAPAPAPPPSFNQALPPEDGRK